MPNKDDMSAMFFIEGQRFEAPKLTPGLYVVATPIGNLGDMTIRALKTLAAADLILCEDTRQSAKLLNHYGIKTRMAPLHEHNERDRAPKLVAELEEGAAFALISDAGTPLLSDPGFPLVRAARDANVNVFAIPGSSALLSGLSIAGLPTDSFTFFGFLPPKSAARKKVLQALVTRTETLVFYESPRRIAAALTDLAAILGQSRHAAVTLELTKKFERVQSGSLQELCQFFGDDETRGEAVILVAGASEIESDEAGWHEALKDALKAQPLRGAVDEIAMSFNIKRKEVYDAALALKNKG